MPAVRRQQQPHHPPGQRSAPRAGGRHSRIRSRRAPGTRHDGKQPPSPRAAPVPRLSQGLQTLGEYKGSGTTERRYIVRRGDGQVIQLSRLLYLVVSSVDGVRDAETISHRVSGRYGAEVTTENIVHLVDHKLAPLGITAPSQTAPARSSLPALICCWPCAATQ